MSNLEFLVLGLTAAGIAWVNWYFFLAERSAVSASAQNGRQEVTIVVQSGYDPAVIRVKRGVPVRLTFDRRETAGCSEEVVFPEFGVKRFLPAFEQTAIDITPDTAGTFEFTCGMSMLRGKLVVEA